ncbi:hypothetical protein CKM354_001162500 [Cercospora kikuchii]|uniref:Uncharacterized protein n=1 Tax=Cercospora kikuchii TaxID=84275 RepID=A0A9P3FIH2_9PEZI|nr:uncharacterized protein CKM354_001162500 [Cercospora kikuchii]GIZ48571.1 hypothetical protein CKM354_001162500 [Cercospora kikuchii]
MEPTTRFGLVVEILTLLAFIIAIGKGLMKIYQWMRNHTFNDLGQIRPQDLLPYFTARNENMPAATLDDTIQREGRLRRHSWR